MRLKHAVTNVLCIIAVIETCRGQSPLGQTQQNMKTMSKQNLPKQAMNFQDSFFLRDLSRGNRNAVQDFLQYHTFLDKPVDILNNLLGIGSKVTANQQPDFSDIARRLVLLGGGSPNQFGNKEPGKGNAVQMMPVFDPNMNLRNNAVPSQRDNVLLGTGSNFMNFLTGMRNEMQRSNNGLSLERHSFRSNEQQNRPSLQILNTNSNKPLNRLGSIDGKPMDNTNTQQIAEISQPMDNSQIQKIGMLSGLQTHQGAMMAEGDFRRRDQSMSRSPVIMGPDDDRVIQFIDSVFAREGAARLGNENANIPIQSSLNPTNPNTSNENPDNGASIGQATGTNQQFGNVKGTNNDPSQIPRDVHESPASTKIVGNNEQNVANGASMNEIPVETNTRIFSNKQEQRPEMSGAGMKHERQNTNLNHPASEVAGRGASILNRNFETIIPTPPSFLEPKPDFRNTGAAQSIVNDMSLNGTQGQNLAQRVNILNTMGSFDRSSINTAIAKQPKPKTQNMREQISNEVKVPNNARAAQRDGQLNPEALWVTLPPRTGGQGITVGANGIGAVMQSGFSNTGQSMAQPFEKLLTPAPRIKIFERTLDRTGLSAMKPFVDYPVTTMPMPTGVPSTETATWPNARQDEIFPAISNVNSPDMSGPSVQPNIDNGLPWSIGIPSTQAHDNGILSTGTIGPISQQEANRQLDTNGQPQLSFADVFALWFRNMANQEPYDKMNIAEVRPPTTKSPMTNKNQILPQHTNENGSNRLFSWFRSEQVDRSISTTPSTATFRDQQLLGSRQATMSPHGTTQQQPLLRLPNIPTSPTMSSFGIVGQPSQRLPALPVLPSISSSGVREQQFLPQLPALPTLPTTQAKRERKIKYRITVENTKPSTVGGKLAGTDRKDVRLRIAPWPAPNNQQMPFGNHGNNVNVVPSIVNPFVVAGGRFSGSPAKSTTTGSTIDC